MSETVNVNIQMDPDLKERAEVIFQDMGLNMSSAINLFVRQTLLQGKIPFAIYADPFYSESNMKALRESVQQAKEGKIVVKTMEELERMADGI